MKFDRNNILTVSLGFLGGSIIMTLGPKPTYVHNHLSIWLVKCSVILFAIWYCMITEPKDK